MRFQLALNKTFYPTHQRLKQLQTKPCFLHPCSPPLPPPPPHRFSTQAQSSQYQNWKANKCSIITVNEQGPPVISIFLLPLILNSNLQFNKTKIENCLPSYNHYTMFIRYWREPWGFKYPSIKSWNNPGKSSFLWNCAGVVKSHTHHLEQTLNYATSLAVGLRGNFQTPGIAEMKSCPHLLSSFHLIKTIKWKMKL